MIMHQAVVATRPCIQIIAWEDLFVVIDSGTGKPSDYDALRRMIIEQRSRHRAGLGCLAIIPADAKPPSEPVRKALNAALDAAPLRCMCWIVEGSGFQAAMVRAVLTGLRFIGHRPYPTHVAEDLEHALQWMLPYLAGDSDRMKRVREAAAAIRSDRESGTFRVI
jgi:hypothetical protein